MDFQRYPFQGKKQFVLYLHPVPGRPRLSSQNLKTAITFPKDTFHTFPNPKTCIKCLGSLPFQLYFDRKCVFLWNRYPVPKIGQLNTHSSYSLTQKQIITPLSRKMWHFVEKIPGTAIFVISTSSYRSEDNKLHLLSRDLLYARDNSGRSLI